MNRIKKLLPFFLFVPFGAGAVAPLLIALGVGAVAIAGFSIYRSMVPVDMQGALSFFSSCWSCGMFSGVIGNLSGFIPKLYEAIGSNIIPIAAGLTFVWFAWRVIDDFIHAKVPDAWVITGNFGTHIIKLTFVAALLIFPLPRFFMDTFAGPIMNIGLSYNHVLKEKIEPTNSFDACVIATALNDKNPDGAFSVKLRSNTTCQIAEFHKLTGLGMTVGWTFLNMAFDGEFMFRIGPVPVFPNVFLIFLGIAMILLFLWALLPVPLYFAQVFIRLSMDLIMLPLQLLGWLFSGWTIFPGSKGFGVKKIIDDVVKDTCGIALVGLFSGIALMLLSSLVGDDGALQAAIQSGDSKYLMRSLMFENPSLLGIVFSGLFIGMFMNAVPAITEALFKNFKTPGIDALRNTITGIAKNAAEGVQKKIKALSAKKEASPPAPGSAP